MKVFISWSGERSKAIAKALNDFLPKIIQALKPFYSPEIEKGATWSNKIDEALAGTSFGIICLTPDNLDSKWIHFESGALFKTPDARIWTFLTDLKNQDVPPPLSKFQHTQAEKAETLALIKTINSHLKDVGGEPVREDILVAMFEAFWNSFYEEIQESKKLEVNQQKSELETTSAQREQKDILGEILEIVRNQQSEIKRLNYKIDTYSRSGININEPQVFDGGLISNIPFRKRQSDSFPVNSVSSKYYDSVNFIITDVKSTKANKERLKKKVLNFMEEMSNEGWEVNISEKSDKYWVMMKRSNPFSQGILAHLESTVLAKFGSIVGEWEPIAEIDF